jgi:uncharacterized protein YjbI with pentapeptide repeats
MANRLKQADSRIKAVRVGHPSAFWASVVGIVPVAIVVAMAPLTWEGYSSNRENITPVATFIGAVVVAYAALKQAATASRRHFAQTEADLQRRIIESFTEAIEQLGSDKLEVRVGAIFALERLSKESPDDYWTIMEVLTAFVRDRRRYTTIMDRLRKRAYFLWLQAGRPENRDEEFWVEAVRLEGLEEASTDIETILVVITRRSAENRQREADRGWRLDLSGTYWRKFDLREVNLERASLRDAHLQGANLSEAHLERASLQDAHLQGANLFQAHLEEASLLEAHLEGAHLSGTHLEGASLQQAHLEGALLSGAHLEGALLYGADLKGALLLAARLEQANLEWARLDASFEQAQLQGASLRDANLQGASLRNANLQGADLSMAGGLTDDQLVSAHGDGKTKLPEGITRPKSWPPLIVEAGAVKASASDYEF